MGWIGELIEETLMVHQKQKKIKKKNQKKGKMALKNLMKDHFLKTCIYNALLEEKLPFGVKYDDYSWHFGWKDTDKLKYDMA